MKKNDTTIQNSESLKQIMDEATGMVNRSIMENQVMMYGCFPPDTSPINPFAPSISDIPPITTIINKPNTIDDYKQKFIELLNELEENLGKCKSINIKHIKDNISVDIKF